MLLNRVPTFGWVGAGGRIAALRNQDIDDLGPYLLNQNKY
jgi:hypothetical protein